MPSITSRIARSIAAAPNSDGKPGYKHVFNDRLRDGRRSLKVWGWKPSQYDQAEQLLLAEGCQVKRVNIIRQSYRGDAVHVIRLHVTE